VVALLISLPAFFLLFLTDRETLGAITLLLGFVIFAATWTYRYVTNLPPFSVKSVYIRLEFAGTSAKQAHISKEYEIRPNQGHLTMMAHRNISADGQIHNICWNSKPIPAANIERALGQLKVTVPIELCPKWKVFPGNLSYDLVDSFERSTEFIQYVSDFPTKVARIHIQMPTGRFCRNVRSTKTEGSVETLHGETAIIGSGAAIKITLRRPPVGTEYAVTWDW